MNYLLICKRKLWLYSAGVGMEHHSDLVDHGRLIHETAYPERSARYREVLLDGVKVDFYDPVDRIIHEIKKSPAFEDAHVWQLKFYIYKMELNGIQNVSGILEYPRQRRVQRVELMAGDRARLRTMCREIEAIQSRADAPEKKEQSHCKNCAYFDFCWSGEQATVIGSNVHPMKPQKHLRTQQANRLDLDDVL
ncbi:MAG: CRISPR-associated protein Cas4 [Leptospiraceae bacterium]|nr:CRISPR-associated protein Cas4 [Leptospiraceae bacterium]MCB1319770.1 CRISPR-associated protein Cas4 [Leptospiraceae bacterium]